MGWGAPSGLLPGGIMALAPAWSTWEPMSSIAGAIAAAGDGSQIRTGPGTYPVPAVIPGHNNVLIEGAGAATVFQATSALTGHMFTFVNKSNVTLRDLIVDMNYAATTKNAAAANQVGIVYEATLAGIGGFNLDNVQLINGWHYGLYVVGASSQKPGNVTVSPSVIVTACGQAATGSDAAVYILNSTGVRFAGKVNNNAGLAAALNLTGCVDAQLDAAEACNNAGQGCAIAGTAANPSSDVRVLGGRFNANAGTYGLVFSQYLSKILAVGGQSEGQTAGSGVGIDPTIAVGNLYDVEAILSAWRASENSVHGVYLNNMNGMNLVGVTADNNGSDGIGAVVANSVLQGILASGNTGHGLALYAGTSVTTGSNHVGVSGSGNTVGLVSDAGTNPSNYPTTSTTPPTA